MDALTALRSRIGLNNQQLKMIAVVSMVIDHTMKIFPLFQTPAARPLYWLLMIIGRLAFPIFAFLIAEGAVRTRNIGKYLLRLGIFAVICEVPYDFMSRGTFPYWGHQNTVLTLFLGLLAIAGYQKLTARKDSWGKSAYLAGFFWMLGCAVAAHVTKSDYRAVGVLLIIGFYFWRTEMAENDSFPVFLMLTMAVIWRENKLQLFSLLAFFPIFLYNNQLGRKLPRYTFYGIYLGHMILLGVLRHFLT